MITLFWLFVLWAAITGVRRVFKGERDPWWW